MKPISVLLFVALLLAFVPCAVFAADDPATLVVQVVDKNGPVIGAHVALRPENRGVAGQSAVTDMKGIVRFANVPAVPLRVNVKARSYLASMTKLDGAALPKDTLVVKLRPDKPYLTMDGKARHL